tara:strand:- start:1 stop:354 length:354 start_codon:yes stop_codon:yes gene_type:complete
MSKPITTHAEYCIILYLDGHSIRQINKLLDDKRGVQISFRVIHKWISEHINIPDFVDNSAFLDGVNAWDNYRRDLDELLGNEETTDGFGFTYGGGVSPDADIVYDPEEEDDEAEEEV